MALVKHYALIQILVYESFVTEMFVQASKSFNVIQGQNNNQGESLI